MPIPQKMKSIPRFRAKGLDLSTASNIEVDIRQEYLCGNAFRRTYPAMIFPDNIVGFVIPKEDALHLKEHDSVAVQVLCVDEHGRNRKSSIVYVEVDELIREGTYGE